MFETSETKKSEAFYKFQSIKTAKYLFIDDLNPKKSGMKIETQIQLWLKELFEHRFENSITKKTYITSNFSRDDFLNQDLCLLDQATVDRLIGSINNNFITSSETESKRY
jgi:DNA replication protein DnaC